MSEKAKVLLIDDDEGFLKANALLLEEAGYAVVTAPDGRAGLAAAKEHRPDVVILDVIMGTPDEGFAVARALRADADLAGAKIVILSGVGPRYQMHFEPDGQWLPVDRVLEKPIDVEELAGVISDLLSEREGDSEGAR